MSGNVLLYVTLPMWWSQWAWPTPHPTLHFSQLFLAPSLSLSLSLLFSSYDLTSVSGKSKFPTPSKHCLILHHHHHPHPPLNPPPPPSLSYAPPAHSRIQRGPHPLQSPSYVVFQQPSTSASLFLFSTELHHHIIQPLFSRSFL